LNRQDAKFAKFEKELGTLNGEAWRNSRLFMHIHSNPTEWSRIAIPKTWRTWRLGGSPSPSELEVNEFAQLVEIAADGVEDDEGEEQPLPSGAPRKLRNSTNNP
jgi:hypothetical protein